MQLLGYSSNEKDGEPCPHVIQIERKAYQLWKEFQRDIETRLGPCEQLSDPPLKHWGGKLAGAVAKLAALLHIGSLEPHTRPDDHRVSLQSMRRAIEVGYVLIEHAIAAHELAHSCGNASKASQIFDWLIRFAVENDRNMGFT